MSSPAPTELDSITVPSSPPSPAPTLAPTEPDDCNCDSTDVDMGVTAGAVLPAPEPDIVIVPDDAVDMPATVLPYLHWTNMRERVQPCLDARFGASHRLVFNLAAPQQDWQSHLDYVVDTGLSIRGVTCFKFGITYWPDRRWVYEDYEDLMQMCVSLCTENCDLTAQAETDAISRYRLDKRCMNRAPGGESHAHYVSPHFLYVVFGTKAQFRKRRDD